MKEWGRWRIGLVLALLAVAVRMAWALAVPTIPVGDFATYRESAIYLAEFGRLDRGFVYMPAWVWLLSVVHHLGGELRASKLLGAVLGGLAAGPLFALTARLMDNGRAGRHGQSVGAAPGDEPGKGDAPASMTVDADAIALLRRDERNARIVGATAALAYGFWPAGVALSSVVGTDIPTAGVMVTALALLCGWGGSRPVLAAAAFGAALGVAAYFRAVALPLTVLSAVYWAMSQAGWGALVKRTAIAIAMTVVLLLPWGFRNQRQSGEFYLTDSHGGITALMGNYPNSEGTHSRALAALFKDLSGRTLLMEPHRQTDRVAYAVAKQWITFDAAWTAGMIALRLERLFALEHGLLYWPLYRPGVLPRGAADWFNVHRPFVTGLADLFYWLFAGALVVGVAVAWGERRWMMCLPIPFAAALTLTYALFVAEPRYRLSTEVLLFPLVALGAVRTAGFVRGGVAAAVAFAVRTRGRRRREAGVHVSARWRLSVTDGRTLRATAVVAASVLLAAAAVVRGGSALRDRHRWAATSWRVDGQAHLAMWRRAVGVDDVDGPSPVRGAAPGALLTLSPGRRQATVQIVLPEVSLPAGPVDMTARISWVGEQSAGSRLMFGTTPLAVPPSAAPDAVATFVPMSPVGAAAARVETTQVHGTFVHRGGSLRMWAQLERPEQAAAELRVLVADVALTVPSSAKAVPP